MGIHEHAQEISSGQIVMRLQERDCDLEWYPTTQTMIDAVNADLSVSDRHYSYRSVLDVGCGDGRVLAQLGSSDRRYGIEKSPVLIDLLPADIILVGTDFAQNTLIDKPVDVVFSNPPYSSYSQWATRIIREANARLVYLVLPVRWQDDTDIAQAIAARGAAAEVILETDFLQPDAERKARARIHVIRVARAKSCGMSDPFDLWFDQSFRIQASGSPRSDYETKRAVVEDVERKVRQELVDGRDVVQVLEQLYLRDMQKLMDAYRALEGVDMALLSEMQVHLKQLKEGLKLKISGLKTAYWQNLFQHFDRITAKLITSRRQAMLEKLTGQTAIDFSVSNAYAVAIWVIKNANAYLEQQLVSVFEKMVQQCNIRNYKSNQKTWGEGHWRWGRKPEDLDRFVLDYRVVVDGEGGLCTSEYSSDRRHYNGLSANAHAFLSDVLTIANCLGYTTHHGALHHMAWDGSGQHTFRCTDRRTGKHKTLMAVRAYKKQTIHIKFDTDFLMAWNVEFGRLQGWLKSPMDAVNEIDGLAPDLAVDAFGSYQSLGVGDGLKLLGFRRSSDETGGI